MQFDARHILSSCNEDIVKVYDKTDGRHWDLGAGTKFTVEDGLEGRTTSIVERVRIKDGFVVEGRRNGEVGVWSC